MWSVCPKNRKSLIVLIALSVVLVLSFTKPSRAEDLSFGVANYITILDNEVKDGDIVASSTGGFYLSKYPYDSAVIGVVSVNPAVFFDFYGGSETSKKYPVILSGTVKVNVTGMNGPIRKGDIVTTSSTPGVGMRADKSGYALGVALEDFEPPNPESLGKINVTLNIRYFYPGSPYKKSNVSLLSIFSEPVFESPAVLFKYLLAGFFILLSFTLGLVYFGRIAKAGVEALGRNPLAARTIEVGVVINVLITVAIVLGGSSIALIILRL